MKRTVISIETTVTPTDSFRRMCNKTPTSRAPTRSKCLTVDASTGETGVTGGRGLTLEEEKAYKDAFAAVMVDTTLGLNVFGKHVLFGQLSLLFVVLIGRMGLERDMACTGGAEFAPPCGNNTTLMVCDAMLLAPRCVGEQTPSHPSPKMSPTYKNAALLVRRFGYLLLYGSRYVLRK